MGVNKKIIKVSFYRMSVSVICHHKIEVIEKAKNYFKISENCLPSPKKPSGGYLIPWNLGAGRSYPFLDSPELSE